MGLAAAQAFAAEGAAVALVDINESALRAAAERLVAAGHKAIAIRCVADEAQVKAMVERSYCLAYASPRSDSHRHRWLRLGTTVGRPNRGNSAR